MDSKKYLLLLINISKHTNKLLLFVSFSIFAYIIFLLISNISSGFDITDESYYILAAQHQGEIFQVIRRAGYYTGVLYFLSDHNLSYHRLFGILILISISAWLSLELYRYLFKRFDAPVSVWDKLSFIIPIMTGALAYYYRWLITPSYNWLALIGIILVFISLLRIVNNRELNYDRYVTLDYFILAFSLNLVFMGKPTTALVLVIISFIFIIFNFRDINLKKALPSSIVLALIVVLGHILLLHGSINMYYHTLIESMSRMALIDSRYTLDNRLINAYELIKEFFFEKFYFHQINNMYILTFITIIILLYILHFKKNILKIYTLFLYVVFVTYSYFLFKYGIGDNYRLLWIRGVELLLLGITFVFISIFFTDYKKVNFPRIIRILGLVLILVFGSFAYSFGTNGNIILTMSGSFILIISAILIISYLLDKILNSTFFTATTALLLSLCVLFALQHAYKYPYRLTTPISEQVHYVDLLGGLYVDKKQKAYIQDLQKIATPHKVKNGTISLIDMTGGSPGANVILDASFFGEQWLAGAYPGSNLFAETAWKPYQGTSRLKKAWVLIAPKGIRKLDLNILNKIGLDFPDNYRKIGTVRTAHRNEVQELWKPINTVK